MPSTKLAIALTAAASVSLAQSTNDYVPLSKNDNPSLNMALQEIPFKLNLEDGTGEVTFHIKPQDPFIIEKTGFKGGSLITLGTKGSVFLHFEGTPLTLYDANWLAKPVLTEKTYKFKTAQFDVDLNTLLDMAHSEEYQRLSKPFRANLTRLVAKNALSESPNSILGGRSHELFMAEPDPVPETGSLVLAGVAAAYLIANRRKRSKD